MKLHDRMITGKTLIDLGYKPDKWFKEAIAIINMNNLCGDDMHDYIKSIAPAPVVTIEPHIDPIAYHKNIVATDPHEASNIDSVFNTMDVLMRTPTIVNGCVMPDACPTGEIGQIPVGGVAVARNAIHPSMHSADICCSVMATCFGDIDPKIVLDAAHQITHFGKGGRKDEVFNFPESLREQMINNDFLKDEKSLDLAKTHLGTQGDGNHFLFVGVSKLTGKTYMVTHHGSRGLGAYLYKKGMKVAEEYRRKISPNTPARNAWIPYSTNDGDQYWKALQIIREWTKLNHKLLHEKTCNSVGLQSIPEDHFWNEHNFVFKDGDLFYHAKGATPLDDKFVPDSTNGLRLIPLNMSQSVLIVRGSTTETNLGFTPHGAGRNMSRSQHIRNNGHKTIDQLLQEETVGLDIRFFSGLPDISELPSAYKNAENVKDQIKQFGLGEIVDEIIPFGCIMAGNWTDNYVRKKKKTISESENS